MKILNFFQAVDRPVNLRVSGGTPITQQNKTMTPRQLVDRLKAGSIDEGSINVPLHNDNNLDDSTSPLFESDELELATFKKEFDRRTLSAKSETDSFEENNKKQKAVKAKEVFDEAVKQAALKMQNNVKKDENN